MRYSVSVSKRLSVVAGPIGDFNMRLPRTALPVFPGFRHGRINGSCGCRCRPRRSHVKVSNSEHLRQFHKYRYLSGISRNSGIFRDYRHFPANCPNNYAHICAVRRFSPFGVCFPTPCPYPPFCRAAGVERRVSPLLLSPLRAPRCAVRARALPLAVL